MSGKLSRNSRVWVLLLAWVLFDGLSWADTLDLSDDIVLSGGVGQPIIEAETSEIKSGICLAVSICLLASMVTAVTFPSLSGVEEPPLLFLVTWLPTSDTPLYQRFSHYRI
jgi:hypothetical protein